MADFVLSIHLFFYYALFSSFYLNNYSVYGGNDQLLPLEMKSLLPTSAVLTSINKGLEKRSPRTRKIHLQNKYKLRSLISIEEEKLYGEGIYVPLTLKGEDDFLATVGFGTPKQDFTLIFDTGSDLTWINCNNNNQSSSQHFFYPNSSSSFSNANCKNSCNFTKTYLDNSYATGYFAKETLTINSDTYPNFVFLCAEKTHDFDGVDGLLGVGPGQFSLIAHTDTSYFSLFCYCLPATDSSPGYIVFGVQAYETCQPNTDQWIQLSSSPVNKNSLTSYSVTLTSITIGGEKLDFSSLEAIIDSGTVITRLPPSIFSSLRSTFQGLMSSYPTAPNSSLLNTCYNIAGFSNWSPPNMVLQFEGSNGGFVDVDLEESAVTFKDSNKVCLAFAGNEKEEDMVIIGNKQHRGLNVFFDIGNKNMTFGKGCSVMN